MGKVRDVSKESGAKILDSKGNIWLTPITSKET